MKTFNSKPFVGVLLFAVLLLVPGLSAFAQQRQNISGVVFDENKAPFMGVAVVEQGTQNGTMSDEQGQWSLSVGRNAIIEFIFVGYKTVSVPADEALLVQMEIDSRLLDDVLVVGYGVQKKSSLTGAVSSVKSEDMEARTITDAASALQGKTSGVQVLSSSARPGASPDIRIRGVSSNNSSSPLYVVDGRLTSGISGISPNDIESMEVLKDGASAAIYGAEAGNGVVLITTKKGKGNGKITYDYQYSSQSV
ncbi:MAG: TonB-dependent receptor plug domain-containing protein, partial [Candidatus Cryptobacteroides sp.]